MNGLNLYLCLMLVSVFVGWAQPARAEDDDAMSESEMSEIVDDLGGSSMNESTGTSTQTAAVEPPSYETSQRTHNDLEDDDSGVDQEVGNLGSQDALHESASSSASSFSQPTPEPEYSTPIPEAKAEPWMSKEAKKHVKKAKKSKKSKMAKKDKKKTKLAKNKKKGKRAVASTKSKKSKDRRLAARKTYRD